MGSTATCSATMVFYTLVSDTIGSAVTGLAGLVAIDFAAIGCCNGFKAEEESIFVCDLVYQLTF